MNRQTIWLVTVTDHENIRHEVLGAFHTQEAAEKRFEQERTFALDGLDENQIMEDQPRLLSIMDSDYDDCTGYVLEAFEQEIEGAVPDQSAPDTDNSAPDTDQSAPGVCIRFSHYPDERESAVFGPFDYAQIRYGELVVGPYDTPAAYVNDADLWEASPDGPLCLDGEWTDITLFPDTD